MRSLLTVVVALVAYLLASPTWGQGGDVGAKATKAAPIVAVFDIQAKGLALGKEDLERLTEILVSSLAAGGVYRIVPQSELRKRLRQQKAASYKDCYDQSCQIAVGRELAAQKSLVTKIHRIGSSCVVTAVMYDLKSATSEGGGNATSPCAIKDIAHSLEAIVKNVEKIGKGSAAETKPARAPAVQPSKPPAPRQRSLVRLSSERLRLTTGDDSREFEVTVIPSDGESHTCRLSISSPCVLPRIALGKVRVVIKSKGLYGFNKALTLDKQGDADDWVDVKVKSRPHALSIVGWALGGVALATGIALGAIGAGIDSQPMITSGVITGGVGAAVVVGSFFLRSTVDALIGFFNWRWDILSRDSVRQRRWTLAPLPGGALFHMRW